MKLRMIFPALAAVVCSLTLAGCLGGPGGAGVGTPPIFGAQSASSSSSSSTNNNTNNNAANNVSAAAINPGVFQNPPDLFKVMVMNYRTTTDSTPYYRGIAVYETSLKVADPVTGTSIDGAVTFDSGPLTTAASVGNRTTYTNPIATVIRSTELGGGNSLQYGVYGLYDIINDVNGVDEREGGAIFTFNNLTSAAHAKQVSGPAATYSGRFLGRLQDMDIPYGPKALEGDAQIAIDFNTETVQARMNNLTYDVGGAAQQAAGFDIYHEGVLNNVASAEGGFIGNDVYLVTPGGGLATAIDPTPRASYVRAVMVGPNAEEIVGAIRNTSEAGAPIIDGASRVDIYGSFGTKRN